MMNYFVTCKNYYLLWNILVFWNTSIFLKLRRHKNSWTRELGLVRQKWWEYIIDMFWTVALWSLMSTNSKILKMFLPYNSWTRRFVARWRPIVIHICIIHLCRSLPGVFTVARSTVASGVHYVSTFYWLSTVVTILFIIWFLTLYTYAHTFWCG